MTLKRKSQQKNSNKIHKEFVINDQTVCDPDEIANKFNDYFLNIARNLADKIEPAPSHDSYLNNPTQERFCFKQVNEKNIQQIINKLKNKSSFGHDYISNKILKLSKKCISEAIDIINQSNS